MKARPKKPIMLSGMAANLMLTIYGKSRSLASGLPVKIDDCDHAKELELAGMIERVHVGARAGVGAVVTRRGKAFVEDAIKHLATSKLL